MKPNSSFAFIDIETTGGNRDGNKITEIGIICVDEGVITCEWSTLINPERSIPWGITQLTGITDDMVAESPKFFSVAKKIIELTEKRIFVAHNVFFDYRFLQREFSELGYTFKREVLCTVRLARKTFSGLNSYSLKNLSLYLNLSREAEHRALADAKACYEVFCRILDKNQNIIIESSPKPLPSGLDEGEINRLPPRPGTYFFYSEKGLLLYIGKAKNIKDRVRQHFLTAGKTKRDLELRNLVAKVQYQEWGSDFVASLMELQLIKSMRPLYNRASRKKNFRYTISFKPHSEPGEELKVSTLVNDHQPRWGSREKAKEICAALYQDAFGIKFESLFFVDEMKKLSSILGRETVIKRLKEKFDRLSLKFTDQDFEIPGRKMNEKGYLVFSEGRLKEIRFLDSQCELEIYPLEDYPDMRRLVEKFMQKKKMGVESQN
jgi:DNA polymerase III epsilon subunit family exonuclease